VKDGRRKTTRTIYTVCAGAALVFSCFYVVAVYRGSGRQPTRPKPAPPELRPIRAADVGEIADFKEPDEQQLAKVIERVARLEPARLAELAVPLDYAAVVGKPARWRFAPVKVAGVLFTADKQRIKGMNEDFVQIELADDGLNLITLLVTKWPEKLKVGNIVTVTGVFYAVRSYVDRDGKTRYAPVVVAPGMTAKRLRFAKRRDHSNFIILALACLAAALIAFSLVLRRFARAEPPEEDRSGEDREEEADGEGDTEEEGIDGEAEIDEEDDESQG